jgi:hypothetical protein
MMITPVAMIRRERAKLIWILVFKHSIEKRFLVVMINGTVADARSYRIAKKS